MITYYVLDTDETCYYSTYRKNGRYLEVYQDDLDDLEERVFVKTQHTNIEELRFDIGIGGDPSNILFEGTEKEYQKYLMSLELLK